MTSLLPNSHSLLPLGNALSRLMDEITFKRKQEDFKGTAGLTTGLLDLDAMIGGLRPGQLIMIGGRPCMGKTSLSLSMASTIALEHKLPAMLFSMNETSLLVAHKLTCQIGELESYKLQTGRLDSSDLIVLENAIGKLREAAIFVDDNPSLSAKEICSRTMALRKQLGQLGLVVIDDWQGISSLDTDNEREQAMSLFRNLAHEVEAPVVLISQLNRRLEKRKCKRPRLCDLPFQGMVRYADLLLLCYLEEHYEQGTEQKGIVELCVARNRNGPTGMILVRFQKQHFRVLPYLSDRSND